MSSPDNSLIQQWAPQQAPPPAPPAQNRSGLGDILHAVANVLGGPSTRQQVNPQTGAIESTPASREQRITGGILSALRGAAAGAAQTGPAAVGKAATAGFEASDQAAATQQKNLLAQSQNVRQTNEAEQQKLLTQASLAKSNQELARTSLDMKQHQMELDEHQVKIAEEMQKIANLPGATHLGHFDSNEDINSKLTEMGPDLAKQYAVDLAKNEIKLVPNPKGGFDAYQVPKAWEDQPVQPDAKIHVIQYGTDPKTGKYGPMGITEQSAPPGMTNGQHQIWEAGQFQTQSGYQMNQANLKEKSAAIAHTQAETAELGVRTEVEKNQLGGEGTPLDDLVKDTVHGNIVPERVGNMLGKKEGQLFLSKVAAEAKQEGIPFDTSKLQAYPDVYKQFTSTKPGTAGFALNAGATGLKHLEELERLNTLGSHVPGTAASKAFNNQLDTLVPELIKFYSMPDTNESVAALKSTLGGVTNRDAAIKQQAHALGQKVDEYHQQWKNAAPSSVYEAPMPQMTDEAKLARAHLDPDYASRLFSVSKWQQANPNADADMLKHIETQARQRGLDIIQ